MTYLIIICLSLIYSIVLNVVYFRKNHLQTQETKYYSILIVFNLFALIFELICGILGHTLPTSSVISMMFTKVFMTYLTVFSCFICLYIYMICFSDKPKFFNIVKYSLLSILVVGILFILYLPISTYNGYATGQSVDFVFAIGTVFITLGLIPIFIRYKHVNLKKTIPFILFMLGNVIVAIIQKYNPEITITTSVECLVMFVMYFTIENPDVKMIEELTKARSLSEQSANEKNEFLSVVTDDIKEKLNRVEKIYDDMCKLNPSEEMQKDLDDLKVIVDNARVKIRNSIDVSQMDSMYLNTINTKYNIRLLLNSIYSMTKASVSDKVDYRLVINDKIPEELYGDSIKLKQVINTLLSNSIRFTNSGYIELRANCIIKNDVCRLIISVEDSGKGINIYKQNEILSNHDDLTKEEINKIDDKDLNLKMVRKIINIIGGAFSIDTNKGNGTIVTIYIDQKIADDKSNYEKKIAEYSDKLLKLKKVALISSDLNDIKVIKSICKKKEYDFEYYDMTKKCLDDVRADKHFDIIVIDENMDKIDAKSFLSKVKEVKSFDGKVFIITNNKDLKSKKEMLDLGFKSILIRPLNKKDLMDFFNLT